MGKEQSFTVRVDFWLSGDNYNLDDATRAVGIEPTQTRKKEDFRLQDFAAVEWHYSTGDQHSLDIEDQLLQIQNVLENRSEQIRQFCNKNKVKTGFWVVIHSRDENLPGTEIHREFVKLAASLEATIGLDIYSFCK
jgi:hypothetical protein